MIDVATGWSERRAVLGRSYLVMEDAFLYLLTHLPFPVLQIHPDNGGEFLNHHMLHFWGEIIQAVTLSRSRPYHKNDNPLSNRKTPPSCGPTWATIELTLSCKSWRSTNSMTICDALGREGDKKLPGAVPGITENVHLTLAKAQRKGDDELLDLANATFALGNCHHGILSYNHRHARVMSL